MKDIYIDYETGDMFSAVELPNIPLEEFRFNVERIDTPGKVLMESGSGYIEHCKEYLLEEFLAIEKNVILQDNLAHAKDAAEAYQRLHAVVPDSKVPHDQIIPMIQRIIDEFPEKLQNDFGRLYFDIELPSNIDYNVLFAVRRLPNIRSVKISYTNIDGMVYVAPCSSDIKTKYSPEGEAVPYISTAIFAPKFFFSKDGKDYVRSYCCIAAAPNFPYSAGFAVTR